MRIKVKSARRTEVENEIEAACKDLIQTIRLDYDIDSPIDIAFVLRNGVESALLKDRVLNR